jgi:hypothetical protein
VRLFNAGFILILTGVFGLLMKFGLGGRTPDEEGSMGQVYYWIFGRWWRWYVGAGLLCIAIGIPVVIAN